MKATTTARRLLAAALVSALLLTSAAAHPNGGKAPPTDEPLNVRYIGVNDNYLVFEITVETDNLKNPELLIDDANIGSLYSQDFSGSSTEKVMIEKNDGQQLVFKLVSGKKIFRKLFTANTVSVENTTVSENTYAAK
jgi:hypothetical protein